MLHLAPKCTYTGTHHQWLVCLTLPQGGSSALAAARSTIAWSHPLAMLLLGVRNVGLGGWMPTECAALEQEVTAWQQEAAYDERDNALR